MDDHTPEELEAIKKKAYDKADEDRRREFEPISATELLLRKPSEITFIVDGLVPAGQLTFLSARPASFKTYLLLEMTKCVSMGEPFLGEFTTTRAGVLFIDEESGMDTLALRMKQLGFPYALDVSFYPRFGFKIDEKSVARLLVICKQMDIKLICIDSFARVSNVKDENDAAQISKALGFLAPLFQANIAVVILHHHGKGRQGGDPRDSMRGSSDLEASASSHIVLERAAGEKRIKVTHAKARMSEETEAFNVTIEANDEIFGFVFEGFEGARVTPRLEMETMVLAGLHELTNGPTKTQLFEHIKTRHSTAAQSTFKTVVDRLILNDKIMKEKGNGNSIKLYLTPERETVEK